MDATMEDLRDESETPALTEWQTKRLETEASRDFSVLLYRVRGRADEDFALCSYLSMYELNCIAIRQKS